MLISDAYYANSHCLGYQCIKYIGSRENYEDAELECSAIPGGCVAYVDNSDENQWIQSWLEVQMETDSNQREIWVGARLNNLRSKF